MGFSTLTSAQKAKRLLTAVINAAKEYYECSGLHIGETAIEHFVQVRTWEAISEQGAIFCTMETSPEDVLLWSDIRNRNAIIRECTSLKEQSRFDIVYFGEGAGREKPTGIIELKIGRTTEYFAGDLKRITEFSKAARANNAKIEFVATLFVEKLGKKEKIDLATRGDVARILSEHRDLVHAICKFDPAWDYDFSVYGDRLNSEAHNLIACIAWVDL
jgi:hypothetical protein